MTTILLLAVLLLYVKWLLIALTYPFMAADGMYRKKKTRVWKVLRLPYRVVERLFRGGWQRYALIQIGCIPSLHLRKALYKGLGANIGKKVVFHYKTEIRAPHLLFVGGGVAL